jgi:hypothetical protein
MIQKNWGTSLTDEMRMELLLPNTELRELRPNLDMTAAIRPLLADTGDPTAYMVRMQKQIARSRDLL